jgi:hypothetical protein
LLKSLGRPTIVKAAIRVHADSNMHSCFPGLSNLLVGSYKGLNDVHGDVFHHESIPPQDVLEIWQPGDTSYATFPDLPPK